MTRRDDSRTLIFEAADRNLTFEEQEEAAKDAIRNPRGRNTRDAFIVNLAARIQAKRRDPITASQRA